MTDSTVQAWRCTSCGYIHRYPEPPEWCPVCGASREEFEPYFEIESPSVSTVQVWECSVCGHHHTEADRPNTCPVCGASGDVFEPIQQLEETVQLDGSPNSVLIVGAGIAGVSAVESVRSSSPDTEIILVSKEDSLPYYRLNLTRYLAGELGEDALPIHPEGWYRSNRVRILRGTKVTALNLDSSCVTIRSGDNGGSDSLAFDRLILTNGAAPAVPPIPGSQRAGVTTLRTIDDARQILAQVVPGLHCVCIGGGILGLETAGALAKRGALATVLEGQRWLMPRQLTERAAGVLTRWLAQMAISVQVGARIAEVAGDGHVRGVLLDDDTFLPAGLVVIATGIISRVELARNAGLRVNRGVIVDDFLCSSHPNVLAAGDVAEHRGIVYGLWPASRYQGTIAGMNAVGRRVEFGGMPPSNALKVLGIDLFSIGQIEPSDSASVAIDAETEDGYLRFVFRDGRMIGSILMGDAGLTSMVRQSIEGKANLISLLASRPSAAEVAAHLGGSST